MLGRDIKGKLALFVEPKHLNTLNTIACSVLVEAGLTAVFEQPPSAHNKHFAVTKFTVKFLKGVAIQGDMLTAEVTMEDMSGSDLNFAVIIRSYRGDGPDVTELEVASFTVQVQEVFGREADRLDQSPHEIGQLFGKMVKSCVYEAVKAHDTVRLATCAEGEMRITPTLPATIAVVMAKESTIRRFAISYAVRAVSPNAEQVDQGEQIPSAVATISIVAMKRTEQGLKFADVLPAPETKPENAPTSPSTSS